MYLGTGGGQGFFLKINIQASRGVMRGIFCDSVQTYTVTTTATNLGETVGSYNEKISNITSIQLFISVDNSYFFSAGTKVYLYALR
jgi:hypothetical protein